MINKIRELAEKYEQEIIDIQSHLHEYPELSFKEYNTASFIEEQLNKHGITSHRRIVDTGILVELNGTSKKKTILLRADIDALPIQESVDNPICSKNNGVMHACGHDMHTASLLGTAFILNKLKEEISGNVLLLFQPGEEYMPSGARMITNAGILKNYNIDWVLGQHTDPELETGSVGFRQGAYMASTDEIFLTVKGRGGHGAFPHLLDDTVMASTQIITACQLVINRKKNPVTPPTLLSFGRIIADGATNIIPSEVHIAGTLRCMDETWRKEVKEILTNTIEHTAKAMGVICDININHGYPAVTNHNMLTKFAHQSAKKYLSEETAVTLPMRMGGEDFGFYGLYYPCSFYRFGVKPHEKNKVAGLHSPYFYGDPKALKTAMGTMSWISYSFLDQAQIG